MCRPSSDIIENIWYYLIRKPVISGLGSIEGFDLEMTQEITPLIYDISKNTSCIFIIAYKIHRIKAIGIK